MASRIDLSSARKRAGAALVDGFFNGVSRLAKLHPKARPERHGITQIKDVRYLEGSTEAHHLLDVYKPANAEGQPWPIVFYIHGGSFRILSKDTHWVMGLGFARAGYLVFNISYRLAPAHKYPAAVEDVCHAFAWAMKNAARFGGDTSRVVIAGESAGANLATALSIALAYERPEPFAKVAFDTGIIPRAVLPACGVFQVSDLGRLKRRKAHMSQFIADRISELEVAYLGPEPTASLDLADVANFFERGEKPTRPLPPFFLPVGTRDPLLPDTRRMAEALTAMGVETEARYYPNELHAFHAFVMRKAARECWRDTYRFLDRHVPKKE